MEALGQQQEVGLAPLQGADSPSAIPGEYIVMLKKGSDLEAHLAAVTELSKSLGDKFEIISKFSPLLPSYAVRCGEKVLNAIRARAEVEYVEANQKAEAYGIGSTGGIA